MQTVLSSSGGYQLCTRRAPADPAEPPSLPVPLGEPGPQVLGPEPSPPGPGHCSHRERLWAVPATPAEPLQPPARPRQRTGISGKLRQHHGNYVIRRSFANGSRKLDYRRVRLFVDDASPGAEAPSEGLTAGQGADTGDEPACPVRGLEPGGAPGQVLSRHTGLLPPLQHSYGRREGKSRERARGTAAGERSCRRGRH